MPFGPLITLMLLVYALFLGVVMTLWFVLSPGRTPDAQENAKQEGADDVWEDIRREKPTRAEERSYRSARAYAGSSNDEVRGANAKANRARANTEDARRKEARTRDADVDADSKRSPARSTTATKKRDAFEDFIRSKNDDFEF